VSRRRATSVSPAGLADAGTGCGRLLLIWLAVIVLFPLIVALVASIVVALGS
jgi:hypothetical protein